MACRTTPRRFLETETAFWGRVKVFGISDGRDILDSIVTRIRAAGVESLIHDLYTNDCDQMSSVLIPVTSAALQPVRITKALW